MENKTYKMLKIYAQVFPDQFEKVTKQELVEHYCRIPEERCVTAEVNIGVKKE